MMGIFMCWWCLAMGIIAWLGCIGTDMCMACGLLCGRSMTWCLAYGGFVSRWCSLRLALYMHIAWLPNMFSGYGRTVPREPMAQLFFGSSVMSTDSRTHGCTWQDHGSGLLFSVAVGWYGTWEPVVLCGPQGPIRVYSCTCMVLCGWSHMFCMYLWGLVPGCVSYFISILSFLHTYFTSFQVKAKWG